MEKSECMFRQQPDRRYESVRVLKIFILDYFWANPKIEKGIISEDLITP